MKLTNLVNAKIGKNRSRGGSSEALGTHYKTEPIKKDNVQI